MKTVFAFLTSLLIIFSTAIAQKETYTSSNKSTRVTFNHSNGISSFNVEMRGKIDVTDDDKDIRSISADGYLEISKVTFGSKRSIKITPEGGGVKREYYEGREKIPFEPEGRKWLGEVLPELVRSTTIAAESRVNRYYKQGGVNGVLGEIDRLEGSYGKAHYANLLMKLNVSAKDYPNIIAKVSSGMDSDHYLTEFLEKNMSKFLQTREASDALFQACGRMESDHYKTQVIKEALQNQSPSPDAMKSLLQTAGQMESDHYITEVLTALMRQQNLSDATISEMISTSKKIESDHYKTIVLKKALSLSAGQGKSGLSATSFQRVLESIQDIESDHYKTEVLTDLMNNKLSNEMEITVLEITSSIESDHYTSVVLGTLLKNQDLSDEAFKKLVEVAGASDSDHYSSTVLQEALQVPNLSEAKIVSVIQAAGNINSDHYITEVLLNAAPKVKVGSSVLKDAYRATAKRIESETYYGRAMKAID
jgi:hypothetical protein